MEKPCDQYNIPSKNQIATYRLFLGCGIPSGMCCWSCKRHGKHMQCFAEKDKGIHIVDWSGTGCIAYHRGTKHYYVTLDGKEWILVTVDPTRGSTKPNTKPDNEYMKELINQAKLKQRFVWEPIWDGFGDRYDDE